MGNILDDLHEGAEWIATALSSSGYVADFSPNSLIEIDRFFEEHSENGQAVQGGLLSESLGSRLFAIGAYVGEVIRRNVGGEWKGDDDDPSAEINVQLELPDGTLCWPVQRVMKRFKLGAEEGIAAYGVGAGLKTSVSIWPEKPQEVEKIWWQFWK
jgi:hypothetical protein